MFLFRGWNNKCICEHCAKCHFGSQVTFRSIRRLISNEWSHNLQQKWVLLQSVKDELSVRYQLFCRHQHWGSLHSVTRKLDLDQTLMARKHTERHKCDKTHFSVRPRDFLRLSPINSALYVVIMFVLVCFCRFLWQIILLTYMSYKLAAHFDLA